MNFVHFELFVFKIFVLMLLAINYWRLPKDAKMRDLLMAVRADEAVHRDVNHVFASIGKYDRNPYIGDPKGPLGLPKE